MGNEDLNSIPIPRESKIGKDCDFPSCDDFQSFKTFSNPLFEKQDDHEETFKSYLNPLFEDDEEIISNEASSILYKLSLQFHLLLASLLQRLVSTLWMSSPMNLLLLTSDKCLITHIFYL
ncbi:hypothetical protein Tco_1241687 [Tanacetum coccineum]